MSPLNRQSFEESGVQAPAAADSFFTRPLPDLNAYASFIATSASKTSGIYPFRQVSHARNQPDQPLLSWGFRALRGYLWDGRRANSPTYFITILLSSSYSIFRDNPGQVSFALELFSRSSKNVTGAQPLISAPAFSILSRVCGSALNACPPRSRPLGCRLLVPGGASHPHWICLRAMGVRSTVYMCILRCSWAPG